MQNLFSFLGNRLGMNKLVAKLDVKEDLKLGHNSMITTSESYSLEGLFHRQHDLDVLGTHGGGGLFSIKINDLDNGNELFETKCSLPDQV